MRLKRNTACMHAVSSCHHSGWVFCLLSFLLETRCIDSATWFPTTMEVFGLPPCFALLLLFISISLQENSSVQAFMPLVACFLSPLCVSFSVALSHSSFRDSVCMDVCDFQEDYFLASHNRRGDGLGDSADATLPSHRRRPSHQGDELPSSKTSSKQSDQLLRSLPSDSTRSSHSRGGGGEGGGDTARGRGTLSHLGKDSSQMIFNPLDSSSGGSSTTPGQSPSTPLTPLCKLQLRRRRSCGDVCVRLFLSLSLVLFVLM